MSRQKKEEYEEEDYEEQEEEEEYEGSAIDRVIAFYEEELEDLVVKEPYNLEKFNLLVERLEYLKRCKALDAQAEASVATKQQAQVIAAEAKSEKIFKYGQLAATILAPAVAEGIKGFTARSQVKDVINYEREGNIFKSGATPFIKKP